MMEPHHPQQNQTTLFHHKECCLTIQGAKKHDWVQKWVCGVHNVVSSKKLGWKSPLEMHAGNTQDISKFCFHIWEPIWYFVKCITPNNPWKKARCLSFADSSGDEMTYFIKTEPVSKKESPQYLIQSVIYTRRKHIGSDQEYINEDSIPQPDLEELELGFLNKS
eukprot:8699991-Ditylum_brightwellii.AAC.1